MLSMCYAISQSAEEAERIWWDMPLCKVWAMLHCYLYSQGITVIFSKTKEKMINNLRKQYDKSKSQQPAYEQNLEQVEYIRK